MEKYKDKDRIATGEIYYDEDSIDLFIKNKAQAIVKEGSHNGSTRTKNLNTYKFYSKRMENRAELIEFIKKNII